MTTELDALAAQAAAIDGEVVAQSPGAMLEAQEQAVAVSLADENAQGVSMILAMAVPLLGKLYPSLIEVYTDEACGAVAGALGPVLAKYGVSLADWGGAYKEEIGALFVCGPIAWATVEGIKADVAARAARRPAPAPQVAASRPPAAGRAPQPGDVEWREQAGAGNPPL